MKKNLFVLLVVMMVGALILTACGGGGDSQSSGETTRKSVPAAYAGKTNPLKGNADAATAGKETYTTYCASCHGETGKGDGPAAASLQPAPANLADKAQSDSEDFLFWVIKEGGSAAGMSASMPAHLDLSDDQIWQVVTFLQTLK